MMWPTLLSAPWVEIPNFLKATVNLAKPRNSVIRVIAFFSMYSSWQGIVIDFITHRINDITSLDYWEIVFKTGRHLIISMRYAVNYSPFP